MRKVLPPREVAVFRSNLFRTTEPFVWQQAEKMKRYRAFYLGRLRFGPAPNAAESYATEDLAPRFRVALAGWQMTTRDCRPFLRVLPERRPSLVHAHFGVDAVHALPLAEQLGVPLITSFHGFDATLSTPALLSSPAWAHYPLQRRRLAGSGRLFLCASAFIEQRLLATGFPQDRTRVHYIGVDVRAITPRSPSEERSVILHVARLVEVKGTEVLLRAFEVVARTDPSVELVILGDGPRKRPLEQLARELRISSRVHFLGERPHAEVLAAMRSAAMLVLPSVPTSTGRVEGLGMVLVEAAATGVPLIGSKIGGIPEVVLDGVTGLLCEPKAHDDLAARILQLLAAPDTRYQMGRAARELAEQRFDIDRQTRRLERMYDEVLDAHSVAHAPSSQEAALGRR